jgi:hypothetical protein
VGYEHARAVDIPAPDGFTALRTYVYGDTAMTLFERDDGGKGLSPA